MAASLGEIIKYTTDTSSTSVLNSSNIEKRSKTQRLIVILTNSFTVSTSQLGLLTASDTAHFILGWHLFGPPLKKCAYPCSFLSYVHPFYYYHYYIYIANVTVAGGFLLMIPRDRQVLPQSWRQSEVRKIR